MVRPPGNAAAPAGSPAHRRSRRLGGDRPAGDWGHCGRPVRRHLKWALVLLLTSVIVAGLGHALPDGGAPYKGWHTPYHSNHLHHQHHHRHKQHDHHHHGHFQPPASVSGSHRLFSDAWGGDGSGGGGGSGGGEVFSREQSWPPENAVGLPAPRTAAESPAGDKDGGGSDAGGGGGGGAVFLSENCTVVLAQTGTTPRLHCEVAEVGESVVSWIRRKDYRLLTVGLATYSSDDRFFTAHVRSQQDWALHVRFSEPSDAGLYECQVSTHPPSSLFVELQLVEAHAELQGGPDKFVKRGSALRLTCSLRGATEPPVYVFWYHGGRMVNFDASRGLLVRHAAFSSELLVRDAQRHHSGNYSCVPSNARPASITVHVINGEEPAAMQHGSKGRAARPRGLAALLLAAPAWPLLAAALR